MSEDLLSSYPTTADYKEILTYQIASVFLFKFSDSRFIPKIEIKHYNGIYSLSLRIRVYRLSISKQQRFITLLVGLPIKYSKKQLLGNEKLKLSSAFNKEFFQ